ncbi:hypothetical protein CAEBREN_04950 [Caenorhabditis brenneri]|uniref:Lipoprotein n=1 Tax=Caenorhabditis brenneri TaxID=135651 RepID=G0P3W3_CAEBE|nr:hypothetical protein CAEBREN_04950 [Caenorhabditis brenneri]
MKKLTIFLFLVAYFSAACYAEKKEEGEETFPVGSGARVVYKKSNRNNGVPGIQVNAGTQLTIPLPKATTYRRIVTNAKGKEIEHLYRVCNKKNKTTCGYWENVETKKKVASGETTFARRAVTINGVTTYFKKKELIISNIRKTDSGKYMTGDKKYYYDVEVN